MRYLLFGGYYRWTRSLRNSKKNKNRGMKVRMNKTGKGKEQEWSVREEDKHTSLGPCGREFVCSPNSHVEILIPNVVFEGRRNN